MKTVAVFFDDPHESDYPLNYEEFRTAYRDLATMVSHKGMRFAIVRSMESFLGGNAFSHYWEFDGEAFVKKSERLDADVILNKGSFERDDESVTFHDPEFTHMCSDKFLTFSEFAEVCPLTVVVHDARELDEALAAMRTDVVVAKPIEGYEGRGVFIGSKQNVRGEINRFPYLIQEFIDTSDGIPGLVKAHHDFRMICVNDEICLCYIRIPPEGSIAVSYPESKEIFVPLASVPPEALAIHEVVEKKLGHFTPRVFSVDVGRDKSGRWMLIELNAKPGLSPASWGPEYRRFLERFAEELCKSVS